MCGIAGILNFDGRPVEQAQLRRMAAALAHRGPDGEGLWFEGPVGLAHRRLAIRDRGPAGRQPVHDEVGRITVTYNGEIYNDGPLRAALRKETGARLSGRCDAELLPTGFGAWGAALPRNIEGIYAFAAWDSVTQTLTLVRDHIGAKPLFYLKTGTALYFASEIKGILAAIERAPSFDPVNLHRFFAQGYASPQETTLAGLYQVPPGSLIVFTRNGTSTVDRFFTPERCSDVHDLEEATEHFLELWREVIREQLVSDVPVGILQSGGIDSSLVTFALDDPAAPLFTAGFTERSHDETGSAAVVAEATGHPHYVVRGQDEASAESVFRSMVTALDGQVADASAFAFYRLAGEVRRHVTVALGGDGADELFGGYPTYRASRIAALLRPFVPKALARPASHAFYLAAGNTEQRLPWPELAFRFAAGLASAGRETHPNWRRLLPAFTLESIYGPAMTGLLERDPFDAYAAAMGTRDGSLVDRCLLADQCFHLPAGLLRKVDAISMAHGLEVRVPFLDRRVIQFASRCHISLLTPLGGPDKRLLRIALRRLGAPAAIAAGTKRGFNVPIAQLLRGPLAALAERHLVRDADLLTPYLRPEGVARLWRAHAEGRANHAYALWPLLTFAVWRESLP